MRCSRAVERPCEFNTRADTSVDDRVQQFALLPDIAVVWPCDEVNADLVLGRFPPNDHFDELHHVSDLVEEPHIGVRHDNLGCARNVRAKEAIVTDPLAILSEDVMPFFQSRFCICLGRKSGLRRGAGS